MRREPVSQLAGVSRQVQRHLLQLLHHQPSCSLVAAELSTRQLLPLADAADDGPHQQVGHVDRDRLRQARELGGVGSDRAAIARRVQGQDLEASDFLFLMLAHMTLHFTARQLTSRH